MYSESSTKIGLKLDLVWFSYGYRKHVILDFQSEYMRHVNFVHNILSVD